MCQEFIINLTFYLKCKFLTNNSTKFDLITLVVLQQLVHPYIPNLKQISILNLLDKTLFKKVIYLLALNLSFKKVTYFDCIVCTTCSNTCTTWMKFNMVDNPNKNKISNKKNSNNLCLFYDQLKLNL